MRPSIIIFALVGAAISSPLAERQVSSSTSPPAAVYTPTGQYVWSAGGFNAFTVHQSCNATQRHLLDRALVELNDLTSHARSHILRFGNGSTIYQKYFGRSPTAEPIGWYSKIVDGDKTGVLFRCDDPDRNCETQAGWAGHYRGSNATLETVLCPLSFAIRHPLEAMCGRGYTVAASRTNFFFASDLMHRVLHVPKISEGVVEHYAGEGGYSSILEAARNGSTLTARDSDALQYFALEAWAFDVAVPGIGCVGQVPSATSSATSGSSASPTSRGSSAAAASTTNRAASATASALMTTSMPAQNGAQSVTRVTSATQVRRFSSFPHLSAN